MSSFEQRSGVAPVHNAVTSETDSSATTGIDRGNTGRTTSSGYDDSLLGHTTGITSSRYKDTEAQDPMPSNTNSSYDRPAISYDRAMPHGDASHESDSFDPSATSIQASSNYEYDTSSAQRRSSGVATSSEPLRSSEVVKGNLEHGPGEVDDSVRVAAVPRSNAIVDPDRDCESPCAPLSLHSSCSA